nr:ComEC/Rec2 family competence protein [Novosphingobium sp. KCTC 2891]
MATRAENPSAFEPEVALPERTARPWANLRRLSSVHRTTEQFLADRPFERGPWLAVAFGLGIATWLVLPGPWAWSAVLALCAAVSAASRLLAADGALAHLRLAVMAVALMIAAGLAVVWTKSTLVGQPGIGRPVIAWVQGKVIDRQEQGAQDKVRLLLAARIEGLEGARRVRINLPLKLDRPDLVDGARVRLRARLMPPAPPMLPGGYDFARAAWFQGLAATGSVLGPVQVLSPAPGGTTLGRVRQSLADHVRARLSGSPGAIAAAFASGDRGAIAQADEDAMRDAGLSHLLSISGLHVSAVVAAVYVLAIRLLALVPFIALRVRLPLVAAGAGALAGIGYTLLTGSEVPTVRSCIGAVLVLAALALGRDPLSLRMLAVAAFVVMLFWPEAVFGPSFQMSFASVIAIIAFHNAAPAKRFLAPREEGSVARLARHLAMLLATGVVIELALMPIGLFHFHRAGVYGAAANVVAIPLTTFVTMPLIAGALVLDLGGWGAPGWYLAGKSLDLLLWLAHVTAAQPGAVTMMPAMAGWTFGLFIGGLLWFALWSERVRLWGLLPVALATGVVLLSRAPDLLVSSDGRQVGITGEGPGLLLLRDGRSDFSRDAMLEGAGMDGAVTSLDAWPGAACNRDFCRITLDRGGRRFTVLLARGRDLVDLGVLAAACGASDIVIADRRLPRTCLPRLLKADRALLARTGGLAIDLTSGRVKTVAETQGHHGWYRWPEERRRWSAKPTPRGRPLPIG